MADRPWRMACSRSGLSGVPDRLSSFRLTMQANSSLTDCSASGLCFLAAWQPLRCRVSSWRPPSFSADQSRSTPSCVPLRSRARSEPHTEMKLTSSVASSFSEQRASTSRRRPNRSAEEAFRSSVRPVVRPDARWCTDLSDSEQSANDTDFRLRIFGITAASWQMPEGRQLAHKAKNT